MFTNEDIKQIETRGVSLKEAVAQVDRFKKGFPYMMLTKPAKVNDGIVRLSDENKENFLARYNEEKDNYSTVKFVPASGAATRMFKDLFSYCADFAGKPDLAIKEYEKNDFIREFISSIKKFAFYADLEKVAQKNNTTIDALIAKKDYVTIIDLVLNDKGLNYGNLPKALIKFHSYNGYNRAALEEHLVEGALYAKAKNGSVNLHFTVSESHQSGFVNYIKEIIATYEKEYSVKYNITYSVQDISTDTIAVDIKNVPFREDDGTLLFRPGGHGALLKNLNELKEDIIVIKNIDNILHQRLLVPTVEYKKLLSGILFEYKEIIFDYLTELENAIEYDDDLLKEIHNFLMKELSILPPDNFETLTKKDKVVYYFDKLNRPIRICGMVKSDKDTGGGPFWCVNPDSSVSLQIVETAQIDMNSPEVVTIVKLATHFNPVDLVCYTKNYKGKKFDLMKFRDPETGFISKKSKSGKDLKALELPGLWNGSMSDWITVMVETPFITFNPVKTVNDLLKPEHQQA